MKERKILIHQWPVLGAANVGQTYTCEIPRTHVYKGLYLHCVHTITDNGGGGNPVYSEDAQYRTVDRLRVVDEHDVPINVSGRRLARQYVEPVSETLMDVAVQTAGLSGAVHTLDFTHYIPFVDERKVATKPAVASTLIRSWGRSTFRFEFTTPINVAEMMNNPGAGAVAITTLGYALYGIVYVPETAEEREILEKGLGAKLRITDTFENHGAGVGAAWGPFNNTDLHRGARALWLGIMALDAGVRAVAMFDTFGCIVNDDPWLPELFPWQVIKQSNTIEPGYDQVDGVVWIDFDRAGDHQSAPITSNLATFRLNRAVNAPVGAGTLELVLVEKVAAQYSA